MMTYRDLRIGELAQESLSFNNSLVEPQGVAVTGHEAGAGRVAVDAFGERGQRGNVRND